MYVSCNFIGQDEGNILLWHMTQQVTIFVLSPSHLEAQLWIYSALESEILSNNKMEQFEHNLHKT